MSPPIITPMKVVTDAITTPTHLFFYSGRTIYSNWYETPDQFSDPLNGGLTFTSSETAFMWWKAVFFQDHKIATLLEQKGCTPLTAKQLGRQIKDYDDKVWECVRLGYMQYVLYLKFLQNPEWADRLKTTGKRVLIEASPTDRVWGCGLDVEAAAAHAKAEEDAHWLDQGTLQCRGFNPQSIKWPGRNLLGQALMTVRSLL